MNLSLSFAFHRLRKIIRNSPNLLSGYNIYVDSDKLRLIDHVFSEILTGPRSFADLGGVWNVNAGYTMYTLKHHTINRAVLVDTNFPDGLQASLSRFSKLSVLQKDFSSAETVQSIGAIDAVFLFDVLLHQANPSWKEILTSYSSNVSCFVIFNQQYVLGTETIRLTDLPLDDYCRIAPRGRKELYEYIYEHSEEIHPEYNKPWKDVHNIFQWGITDNDLRSTMISLGFQEVYYKNHGRFSNLPAFENHAFVFIKR